MIQTGARTIARQATVILIRISHASLRLRKLPLVFIIISAVSMAEIRAPSRDRSGHDMDRSDDYFRGLTCCSFSETVFSDATDGVVGAGGRTRTDMSLTSPDFESGAYTNFATPASRWEIIMPVGLRCNHTSNDTFRPGQPHALNQPLRKGVTTPEDKTINQSSRNGSN